MKKVILKSLTMINFRGEKERTTEFNSDVTTISGANGLGKSRHFDAFVWLLFGKDSADRKDYEIKTRIGGEELHKAECSVSGVLTVDGVQVALKRAIVEDWVKPRGQVEQRFKGNHTECWWNGTPVQVTEYDNRVRGIVDSQVFKMITNPAFFVNMPWKARREQLFLLAGAVDDAEIAAKSPDFALLLDKLSGKSMSDFKAEIAARKKRLKAELEQIQPRIDQTIKMKPESEDFAALDAERAEIEKEIADIDESIRDLSAAMRKAYEAEQSKQRTINGLKLDLINIEGKARQAERQKAFDANAERRERALAISDIERELAAVKDKKSLREKEVEGLGKEIARRVEQRDRMRREWNIENAKEYNGMTVCPTCLRPLPDSQVEKSMAMFVAEQRKRCAEITARGKEVAEMINDLNSRLECVQSDVAKLTEQATSLSDRIAAAKSELDAMPVAAESQPVFTDIPEWVEKNEEIRRLESQLSTDGTARVDTSDLQKRKGELDGRRNAIITRLARREQIAKADREVGELERRGKELGQLVAECEGEEYTIGQFTKTKIEECERRINGLFSVVTFRLFDYTIEGNAVETCVPLIDGVTYGSANRAAQVNAGLDIINALCRFNDICAPIFFDNAESVNDYIGTESQMIFLKVTTDKELIVE